jgi:hypothetical protein
VRRVRRQRVPPTPDFKATEERIAFNIMATLTASAPTATNTPTITPTSTNTPTPTSTPTLTVTPRPTATPTPTVEPWTLLCAQVPADKAGLVVTNYIGEKEIVVSFGKEKYTAKPLADTLIILPTGTVEVSFTAPGWGPGWNWSEKWIVNAGRCRQYPIWYTRQ